MESFIQSYENNTILDSSILIAPLVFFITPNDPRFLNTVDRILLAPEKGGLTSAGLVYRYNTELANDGKSPLPPRDITYPPTHIRIYYFTNTTHPPRRRRPRRRIQHVHLLARRSANPRIGLRAAVPRARRQPLREHAQLLEPPVHVLRGDRAQRRAARQHAPSLQPSGPHQRRL